VGDTTSSLPPNGIGLPILLADGAVITSRVVMASRAEIIIELAGYGRRMVRARHSRCMARRFPGSEWILGKPFVCEG
jgi:hypothetical protein